MELTPEFNGAGDLYIVQSFRSITGNLKLYVFGWDRDALMRLKQFPKDTQLIFRVRVPRMLDAADLFRVLCRRKECNLTRGRDLDWNNCYQGDICVLIRNMQEAAIQCYPVKPSPLCAQIANAIIALNEQCSTHTNLKDPRVAIELDWEKPETKISECVTVPAVVKPKVHWIIRFFACHT